MYEDYGNMTCGGYPGVLGSEELDIATFVEWEIDYLKLDGCYIKPEAMDEGKYTAFLYDAFLYYWAIRQVIGPPDGQSLRVHVLNMVHIEDRGGYSVRDIQ